jgi:hypothetical protein
MIFWTSLMTAFVGAMSVANLHNLNPVIWPILTLASVGVGAVIIPCSIICQIVAPTELIGTITAITLSVRYIGGAVGFTAYYNVLYHKFYKDGLKIGYQLALEGYSWNITTLTDLVTLAGTSQYGPLQELIDTSPQVLKKAGLYERLLSLTQEAFVSAYRWPYWISIAFGGLCILFSFGIRDIRQFL